VYSDDLLGPGEARLDALVTWARENCYLFRDAFKRDTIGASLFTTPFPSDLDSDIAVAIGDVEQIWPTSEGALRVRICAGGAREGLDYSSFSEFIPEPNRAGFRHVFSTNIYVYLHPELDLMSDHEDQATKRELVRERLSDIVIFGMFNRPPVAPGAGDYRPRSFMLTSTVCTGGAPPYDSYDTLSDCRIVAGYKGMFYKALGANMGVFGMHFTHTGHVI